MALHPKEKAGQVAIHQAAVLTGISIFVSSLALDALDLWPHSFLRAAIVGGVSWTVSSWISRWFNARRPG